MVRPCQSWTYSNNIVHLFIHAFYRDCIVNYAHLFIMMHDQKPDKEITGDADDQV